MKIKRKGQSVQELMGIKAFTEYGLATNRGELLFFSVAPTNISVLSQTNVGIKIHHLMMVLSTIPDIEIVCTDASECFDDNKQYLKQLKEQEKSKKVREIISKDEEFLDRIQTETATARQFMMIWRCKNAKPEQIFQMTNTIAKTISEQGFEVRRMKKDDIKRFLALCFDASVNGEQIPDTDGGQYMELGNGFGDYVRTEENSDE